MGSNFFVDNSLFIHPIHEIMIDTEFAVPTLFKLLPLIFTVSFSILAIIFSEFLPEFIINFKFSRLGYNIFGYFNQRFLIELFYNKYITNLVLKLGEQSTKILDKGSIELVGPRGGEIVLMKLSKSIENPTKETNVSNYGLIIVMGMLYIIFFFLLEISTYLNLMLVLLVLFTGTSVTKDNASHTSIKA